MTDRFEKVYTLCYSLEETTLQIYFISIQSRGFTFTWLRGTKTKKGPYGQDS